VGSHTAAAAFGSAVEQVVCPVVGIRSAAAISTNKNMGFGQPGCFKLRRKYSSRRDSRALKGGGQFLKILKGLGLHAGGYFKETDPNQSIKPAHRLLKSC
jgi:hypothetical protein